jgi:hypothetical protein
MSNNILEQEKEVTIKIPVKDYLFAGDMGKYLYVQGVIPGPTIEDFTKQAFYFYINAMGRQLGQKPIPYPTNTNTNQAQSDVQIQIPSKTDVQIDIQSQQQPPGHQKTLFPQSIQQQEQEEKSELDMSIDEMFEKTMSSNMEEEMARIRRFSGAGQNVHNQEQQGSVL